jgi:hypothetical protein
VLPAVNAEVVMEESPNRPSSGEERQGAFYRELCAAIVRMSERAGLWPARAADVAQSVCLKFFKKFPDLTGPDKTPNY